VARIQTPQHVQALQTEFKVRGPFGLELIETIQPVVLLGSQQVASEGYPRKAMGRLSAAAGGVGTNVEAVISCPADVGIILLLTRISFGDIGGFVELRADDGSALTDVTGSAIAKQFRDTRINPAQIPQGIIQGTDPLTAAPNGTKVAEIECPANVTVFVDPDVVIGGGGYFVIRQPTANTAVAVNFEWTEFLLEDR